MDLYIIQSDITGDFKIGKSKHPKKRLKQLQTGNACELRLVLVLKDQGHREKRIHRYIEEGNRKKRKGEWFEFDLISYLPDEIYEQLDLELFNTWWDKKTI